jgi:mannonate dehydratase
MGNGMWSSGRAKVRGADAREFDLASPNKRGTWAGRSWQEPLSDGRVHTPDEIWDNYTYLIKQVVPVAEETGVRIAIHPDDPPVPVLAGVPRCIFSSFEGYKRALEIVASPNVGICLCCGTRVEGGNARTTKDPEEMIRYFGAETIPKIHFRHEGATRPCRGRSRSLRERVAEIMVGSFGTATGADGGPCRIPGSSRAG